jgi:hypothetical protein
VIESTVHAGARGDGGFGSTGFSHPDAAKDDMHRAMRGWDERTHSVVSETDATIDSPNFKPTI